MRQICTRRAEALKEAAYTYIFCCCPGARARRRAPRSAWGATRGSRSSRATWASRGRWHPGLVIEGDDVLDERYSVRRANGFNMTFYVSNCETAGNAFSAALFSALLRGRVLSPGVSSRFLAAEIRPPPPRPRLASSASRCQIRRAARMPQIRTAPTIRLPEDWQRKPCWRHQCLLLPQARLS